ncbi:WD repeat-containing protein PAC11 [Nakaseomyces glabratus]|uniref:WD repeat-containing protein PAC11 n=1 Tax=Candida glabrata TaxID=5478 RepID=A0A0W0C6M1_CANGB|nr:WD repeat-containing protein PAC11 [Nakaseomyces glabratus]KTB07274.1 WD repeat-containing protein PAC11 [Nakaseomyces glabratus]KTB07675.1 WD repeat-containing protein PAC11 [Nakaseomyces glabratus]KTB21295.1 WD repeat-containing protein PAC11 [Nakaseomyces glabratus]OXB43325.1 hypothetical protein B1J91_G04565g [Nakaseomyces glabratus]
MSESVKEKWTYLEELRRRKQVLLNGATETEPITFESKGDGETTAQIEPIIEENKQSFKMTTNSLVTEDVGVQTMAVEMIDEGFDARPLKGNDDDILVVSEQFVTVGQPILLSRYEHSKDEDDIKFDLGQSGYKILTRWIFDELIVSTSGKLVCVSTDYFDGKVIFVFQQEVVDKNDIQLMLNSWLILIDINRLEDKIQRVKFEGQKIIRGQFVNKSLKSKILTILLTSNIGKTIICEFKTDSHTGELQHSIALKNYHYSPIYAIDEFQNVSSGDERFLTASANGILNMISSTSLQIYDKVDSGCSVVGSIKIVPPKRALVLERYNQFSDDDITDIDERELWSPTRLFVEKLYRVSMFEEIGVTSLSISPENNNQIFVGTEDGGIYKIMLDSIKDKKISISMDNHGFLPEMSQQSRLRSIFHTSDVTSLKFLDITISNKFMPSILLLSSSMDNSACIWDTLSSQLLTIINEQLPVLQADWLLTAKGLMVCILTWTELKLYSITYNNKGLEHQISTRILASSLLQRENQETAPSFSTFNIITEPDKTAKILIGTTSHATFELELPE